MELYGGKGRKRNGSSGGVRKGPLSNIMDHNGRAALEQSGRVCNGEVCSGSIGPVVVE